MNAMTGGACLLLWALTVLPVAGQSLNDKDRRTFGKHASRAEAWGKSLNLVLDYERPPEPLKSARPQYPSDAYRRHLQGKIVLMVAIDAAGRVSEAEVLESVKELDAAAIACAKSWIFKPALKDGQPVPTVAAMSFRFGIVE